MMTLRAAGLAAVLGLFAAGTTFAQEPPKPGPEHEILKKHVGTWDVTMKMGGADSKGTSTYKMELGGLWLTSTFEGEVFGTKFQGRGMDTYDAGKKKFIGFWCDSMSTSPLLLEGTYDAATKTLTLLGEGPGPDGKPQKHKSVTKMVDDDNFHFDMYVGDGKDPMFTILYKRKK